MTGTVSGFKNRVQRFMRKHKMSKRDFGQRFAGDFGFVTRLEKGREPYERTRNRILEEMKEFEDAGK